MKVNFSSDANAYRITLNDPPLHILDLALLEDLRDALGRVAADRHVLIIDATGEKAFSAGASVQDHIGDRVVTMLRRFHECFRLLAKLDLITVALVKGVALGGGCELALACHIRFASENARLGLPEVGLGIIPGYGGTQRLPRIVGLGHALELITTARVIDAQEALRIGLVNRVLPAAELIPHCEKVAGEILSRGALAVRYAMDAAIRGMETDLTQGLEREAGHFGLLAATTDMHEGLKAFLEKRKPTFTGA